MSVAIVTGGSRGLGKALTEGLLARGWTVVTDARHAADLKGLTTELGEPEKTENKGLRAYFEANGKAQLDPLWSVTSSIRIASASSSCLIDPSRSPSARSTSASP